MFRRKIRNLKGARPMKSLSFSDGLEEYSLNGCVTVREARIAKHTAKYKKKQRWEVLEPNQ